MVRTNRCWKSERVGLRLDDLTLVCGYVWVIAMAMNLVWSGSDMRRQSALLHKRNLCVFSNKLFWCICRFPAIPLPKNCFGKEFPFDVFVRWCRFCWGRYRCEFQYATSPMGGWVPIKTGLSPQVFLYWPFQGGTSVVVPYCYLFLMSVFILWFSYYVSDIFRKF